jgi:hypothetical protein
MLRRRGGDRDAIQIGHVPPIQFRDACRWNPPTLEPLADAERCDDPRRGLHLGERKDRRAIQVIVVVVRQDDAVDRRQRVERSRRRVKPLRTRKWQRGHTVAPDGISEDAHAIDFDEQRGVPQPCHTQAGRGPCVPEWKRVHKRQWRRRDAVLVGTEEVAHRGTLDARLEP